MKKWLTFVVGVNIYFCSFFANAQVTMWQKETGYSNYIGAVTPIDNQRILITDNRVTHSPFNQQTDFQDIIIYSFDFNIGFLDSLQITRSNYTLFCSNIVDIDGFHFVGYGNAYEVLSNNSLPYIFWFDKNLNFIRDTILPGDTCNFFMLLHSKMSDNKTIISGIWNSDIVTGLSGPYVVLLDSAGNLEDRKFLVGYPPLLYFIEIPTAAGLQGISTQSICLYSYNLSNDSILWQNPPMHSYILTEIAVVIGGNNYAQLVRTVGQVGPNIVLQSALFFRDQNAHILDTVSLATPDSSESISPDAFKLSSQGDILIGQTLSLTNDQGYSFPFDHDMSVTCLDQSGLIKWRRKFNGSTYYSLQYLAPMNDGGCVIAGTIWNWEATWPNVKDNFFLARLTQNGDIVAGTVNPIRNQLTVYPNPANERIKVEVGTKNLDFSLYNLFGVKFLDQTINGNADFSLQEIPSGLYLYKIKDDGHVISTGKVVVIH